MRSENFDGARFVLRIPSPHPQQQTSVIQLLLQVMRMVIADPFGQNRADEIQPSQYFTAVDRARVGIHLKHLS